MRNPIASTFMRKVGSSFQLVAGRVRTARTRFAAFFNSHIHIGAECHFGRAVRLKATDDGRIDLGQRVHLSDGVQIVVQSGTLTIGDDVFIGHGCVIVCRDRIEILSDTLIAEYVVIRDQDHRIAKRPIRIAGFQSSPIRIGCDVWIGAKASVLRGGSVGDRSVVGAHALVRTPIPCDVLAAGVPAKVIRSLDSDESCRQE